MRNSLAPLLVLLSGGTALADGFCDQLAAVDDATQTLALPLEDAPEGHCAVAIELGVGPVLHCDWAFAYRSDAAVAAFETTVLAVGACIGPETSGDALVNHPDSYDLRMFEGADGVVSVSLKDKGGLQETHLFLRLPV